MKKKLKIIRGYVIHVAARLVLLAEFILVSIKQIFTILPGNKKKVFFTLDDDRLYRDGDGSGRYAYMILSRFTAGGYNVYLHKKMDFRQYVKLGKYGRLIYSLKNLKFTGRLPKNTGDFNYAFDTVYEGVIDKPWRKLTYVNVLKAPYCKVGEVLPIPYFFHPFIYKFKGDQDFKKFRKNEPKIKMFFAGNTVSTYYSNQDVKRYGQLTRREGAEAVSELGSDKVKTITNIGEFNRLLESDDYQNAGYLLRIDSGIKVKITEWFNVVAKSDFFLCLSGTDLPMCHNAVESLAVGTIPIIGYPDWFFPPLEHRKNAIVYSGKEDLINKVREVLAMTPQEIGTMRKNAVEYFDQYLSNVRFIERYEASGYVNTIMLHPRLIPTPAEEADSRLAMKEIGKVMRLIQGKGYIQDENISIAMRD